MFSKTDKFGIYFILLAIWFSSRINFYNPNDEKEMFSWFLMIVGSVLYFYRIFKDNK